MSPKDAPLKQGHCQVCGQLFNLDEIGRIPWHASPETHKKCLGSGVAPNEKKV